MGIRLAPQVPMWACGDLNPHTKSPNERGSTLAQNLGSMTGRREGGRVQHGRHTCRLEGQGGMTGRREGGDAAWQAHLETGGTGRHDRKEGGRREGQGDMTGIQADRHRGILNANCCITQHAYHDT
eukprot:364238-Chlamydomonas_euryale.AAC.13